MGASKTKKVVAINKECSETYELTSTLAVFSFRTPLSPKISSHTKETNVIKWV